MTSGTGTVSQVFRDKITLRLDARADGIGAEYFFLIYEELADESQLVLL